MNTLAYSTSQEAVTVNLGTNTFLGGHAQGDVVSDFDNLIGSDFADALSGNSNANILDGGAGIDTLTGGAAVDRFVLHNDAGGQDIIADFVQGTDLLRFSQAELGITNAGLAAHLYNNATGASNTNGGPELFFNNLTSQLFWDSDGVPGDEVLIATLTGHTANLTVSDFDLIA